MKLGEPQRAYIASHRVARMATVDEAGQPYVVPICYAFDGKTLYSPIDEKPKTASLNRLRRLRNISVNPSVCLVIDDYSEDWSQLSWAMIIGEATILSSGDEHHRAVQHLRQKYPQYRTMALERPIIKIIPLRIAFWGTITSESSPRQEEEIRRRLPS